MANLYGGRQQECPQRDGREAARESASFRPDTVRRDYGDSWSDYDLVYCRDQKYRRLEPGSSPLVAGIPKKLGGLLSRLQGMGHDPKTARRILKIAKRNRPGQLRGYGNALCLPIAVEFVRCVMEMLGIGEAS